MAFPEKSKLLKRKISWHGLGEVEGTYSGTRGVTNYITHTLCHTTAHVGRENNILFLYCPRCLVKLD